MTGETGNRAPYDALYKKLYGHRVMIRSLLETFVPCEIVASMDLDTLRLWTPEHVADTLHVRRNDMIWKVNFRNGDGSCYLLVMLEFQSSIDYWMVVRAASYALLLWQGIIAAENLRAGNLLPPVFPIVIYNGKKCWNAPCDTRSVIQPIGEQLLKYQPLQEFFLLDERHLAESNLRNDSIAACMATLLNHPGELEVYAAVLQRLRELMKKNEYQDFQRDFIKWLGLCIFRGTRIEDKILSCDTMDEVQSMLDDTLFYDWEGGFIEKGRAEGRAQGMAEGRAEGRAQGMAEGRAEGRAQGRAEGQSEGLRQCILVSLGWKFGQVPQNLVRRLEKTSDTVELERLFVLVHESRNLDDFSSHLPG